MLKMTTGILFSSQHVTAVISILLVPLAANSLNEMCSNSALLLLLGGQPYSASPATPLRTTSALISEALSAAAVSVVKSGFPIPAPIPPKITTLPFSRWRMARRLMYGSATSCIISAVWTRVSTPIFSSEAWSNTAFITAAIIPIGCVEALSVPVAATQVSEQNTFRPPMTIATSMPWRHAT